jgi:hypothetical protein
LTECRYAHRRRSIGHSKFLSASRYYRRTDWTIDELMCVDNATYEPFENALLEYDERKKE